MGKGLSFDQALASGPHGGEGLANTYLGAEGPAEPVPRQGELWRRRLPQSPTVSAWWPIRRQTPATHNKKSQPRESPEGVGLWGPALCPRAWFPHGWACMHPLPHPTPHPARPFTSASLSCPASSAC